MQTAMGSSISMTVFTCRDHGSATTKDNKISKNNCIDQRSTANVKTKDQELTVTAVKTMYQQMTK